MTVAHGLNKIEWELRLHIDNSIPPSLVEEKEELIKIIHEHKDMMTPESAMMVFSVEYHNRLRMLCLNMQRGMVTGFYGFSGDRKLIIAMLLLHVAQQILAGIDMDTIYKDIFYGEDARFKLLEFAVGYRQIQVYMG